MTTTDPKIVQTLAGARRRLAMEQADLPADLPDVSKPPRPTPPAQYQRDLPAIPPEYVETPADALFPEPAAPKAPKPQITLATTVQHRGRQITITATDMTADQFCDLLDRRGFQAPEQSQQWQTLPDGTPICPKHHAPMRQREKQGDSWWSHNVGTKDQPIYCKGYHGKDSPGYEY